MAGAYASLSWWQQIEREAVPIELHAVRSHAQLPSRDYCLLLGGQTSDFISAIRVIREKRHLAS